MQETPVQMTDEDKKRVIAGFTQMLAEAIVGGETKAGYPGVWKKDGNRRNPSKELVASLIDGGGSEL